MILAVDMGNTNIVIGCVDDEKIHFEERISTDYSKTEIEYYVLFKTVLELHKIDDSMIKGAIISSVVPPLIKIVKNAIFKLAGIEPLIVGPGVKTGLNIMMDNPKQVGSDLIVDAVAGIHEYGAPIAIVDIGTATTISVVDKNKNYIGGVIMPGVISSSDSLVERTAQLPRVSLEAPDKVIGKNTIDCMKSGIILGNASCIDGMLDRIEEQLGYKVTAIATGGLSKVIIPNCKHKIIEDQELLLKGVKVIYDKNMQ